MVGILDWQGLNSLIRVNALVGFLAIEEVGNKFDDTRDTSGTTNQDDFMDVRLVDVDSEDLLNRFKSTAEKILAELFETGTSEGSVEIDTLEERVDFDGCLDVWVAEERVHLARSQAVQRRRTAWGFDDSERSK
jgi:hypothetical protein